ncbi:lysozyme inhibitor LprI family protein [Pseudomonas sp. NPDC086278]|uniref:lysozyme inhibitor LprI family protein n=1 Tax=Pseudomonas sp. NPDC086278 TaxID=3390646 RepID=UPI003D07CF55
MKRFVLGVFCALTCLAVLPVSTALAQDECNKISASQQIDKCSEVSKVAADSQLNMSYHQLMARLETQYLAEPDTGTAYTAKVKDAQRAWMKLRDANCPLEAFEIKPGTSAYVTTVNNCIARMSRERSVFLDGIAPDIVSGSAVGRGSDVSCPSENFAQFLPVFSANPESQRRLTAPAVKILVLKRTEDRGRFEPSITAETGSGLAFPLMSAMEGKTAGLQIESVDDNHMNVVDKRAGNSNIKIFNFAKKSCWAMVGIEDWSISEKELVASSRPGMSRVEDFCYQRAEGLGGLGFLQQYRLTGELIEASLENYVCAAASGDPQASLSAARLSLSQMAPQLETIKVEALFKAAATTLPDGALGYAAYFCNGNSTDYNGPCLHPEQAEREVIRAVSMGSTEAMNILGSYFESGDLGTKDMSRALACYQLSADKGNPQGINNVGRLGSQGAESIKASHCI